MSDLHADALRVLESWPAGDREQEALRASYVAHLRAHPDGLQRSCLPAHVTASVLVLDPAAEHVLLTHHRLGDFWVQLGGHCEADDTSLAEAAMREGREESGLDDLRLVGDAPVELDRHALSSAFGSCREHLDVRYAAVAPAAARPAVSAESYDVAWFPVDALPDGCADIHGLLRRARSAVIAAAARG